MTEVIASEKAGGLALLERLAKDERLTNVERLAIAIAVGELRRLYKLTGLFDG